MELPQQLPPELWFNVMKYLRHPNAEILTKSDGFKCKFYKSFSNHGDAFDRGSADAYYCRPKNPHKKVGTLVVIDLDADENEAYHLAYESQVERRW